MTQIVPTPLPSQLQNGQVVDASGLMVNFNAIMNAVNTNLANTLDPTIGAGATGYGEALAYAAGTVGSALQKRSVIVNSIAALRLLLKSGTPWAFATGWYAPGDAGGGQYYYDAADTTSADNGGTIIVAADGGRWKLATQGPVTARQFGAKGDGVTDDRAALAALDAAGLSTARLSKGTYFVGSNLTLATPLLFDAGAVLQPAAGVTITLGAAFQAPLQQLFDLTKGGVVGLPRSSSEVWAEWWGAKGDLVKTNNEVAFNQAWYALAQTAGGVYGGTINFDRGYFLISGSMYLSDNISHKGHGFLYSDVKANAATWSGSQMLLAQSAVPIGFTGAPAAAATSATLSAAWTGATGAYTVVFFETAGAACETRSVTLTNGATTATWAGGLGAACTVNAMALTLNSMFNSRVEQCRYDASDLFVITDLIYAPAWQEKCGTDNFYGFNFRTNGVRLDTGYGGAAQVKLRRTELFLSPNAVAGAYCINAAYGNTVGWTSVELEEVQVGSTLAPLSFTAALAAAATSGTLSAAWAYPSGAWNVWFVETAGGLNEWRLVTLTNGATTATWATGLANACNAVTTGASSPNITGIRVNGRVILNVNDVHVEQAQNGVLLQLGAVLTGVSLKPSGNNDVQALINCAGNWVGTINVKAAKIAGATNLISDSNRAWAIANLEPYDDNLVWPPDPGKPIVSALITGGAAPAVAWQRGSMTVSVAHQATGLQRITLSTAFLGVVYYDAIVASLDTGAPIAYVAPIDTTHFDVYTRSTGMVATDASTFTVKVYPRPA